LAGNLVTGQSFWLYTVTGVHILLTVLLERVGWWHPDRYDHAWNCNINDVYWLIWH